MAWIERAPGGWRARWREGRGAGARARSRTFRRKVEAERFLATVQADQVRGTYIDPSLGQETIRQFWPRFLEASPHLAPSTRRLYEMLARRYLLPRFGARPLAHRASNRPAASGSP
jgi:hypothetical protein